MKINHHSIKTRNNILLSAFYSLNKMPIYLSKIFAKKRELCVFIGEKWE